MRVTILLDASVLKVIIIWRSYIFMKAGFKMEISGWAKV